MKNEDFKKVIEGMQKKLGKENSSVIADDLGNLISDNITMNQTIEAKNNEIKEKEELNQKLVFANSSLLQQVGVQNEEPPKTSSKSSSDNEEEEKISWEECFDKKGNFLK